MDRGLGKETSHKARLEKRANREAVYSRIEEFKNVRECRRFDRVEKLAACSLPSFQASVCQVAELLFVVNQRRSIDLLDQLWRECVRRLLSDQQLLLHLRAAPLGLRLYLTDTALPKDSGTRPDVTPAEVVQPVGRICAGMTGVGLWVLIGRGLSETGPYTGVDARTEDGIGWVRGMWFDSVRRGLSDRLTTNG